MAAQRIQYQIVGRYMDGKEVTAYHLQSMESGKSGRYTREQVCYLVGRGQITNCEGQIYADKLILRGKNGINLDELPVQQEDGRLRNTESVGKIRKGATAGDIMTQVRIIGSIKSGRNTVGYILQNSGGSTMEVTRDKLLELVQAGRIGNARLQNYNGKILLRGIGCNLDELPSKQSNE